MIGQGPARAREKGIRVIAGGNGLSTLVVILADRP